MSEIRNYTLHALWIAWLDKYYPDFFSLWSYWDNANSSSLDINRYFTLQAKVFFPLACGCLNNVNDMKYLFFFHIRPGSLFSGPKFATYPMFSQATSCELWGCFPSVFDITIMQLMSQIWIGESLDFNKCTILLSFSLVISLQFLVTNLSASCVHKPKK